MLQNHCWVEDVALRTRLPPPVPGGFCLVPSEAMLTPLARAPTAHCWGKKSPERRKAGVLSLNHTARGQEG